MAIPAATEALRDLDPQIEPTAPAPESAQVVKPQENNEGDPTGGVSTRSALNLDMQPGGGGGVWSMLDRSEADVRSRITKIGQDRQKLAQAQGREADATQQQALREAEGVDAAAQAAKQRGDQAFSAYQQQIAANPLPAFVPTKDTANDLVGLFSLMGVVGMMLSKGPGKDNAMGALGAMTGMMKGWTQGRQDLYLKERDEFDKKFAAVKSAHEQFYKELQEAHKLAKTDYEAGVAAAKLAAAKAGAPIVAAKIEQAGLSAAIDTEKDMIGAIDKMTQFRVQLAEKEEARRQALEVARVRAAMNGAGISEDEANAIAHKVALYAMDIRTVPMRVRKAVQAILAKDYPDYQQAAYGQRDLAYRNWTNPNGTGAKQIASFATVANHMDTLERLAKAMQSGDVRQANRMLNFFQTQLGHPDVTNLTTATQAVGSEIVRAITGTAGALADREEAQAAFSAASSPEQILGALAVSRELIGGRLDTTRSIFVTGTGKTEKDFENLLPPKAKTMFADYLGSGTASGTANSAPSGDKPQPTDADREWAKKHPEDRQKFIDHFGVEP